MIEGSSQDQTEGGSKAEAERGQKCGEVEDSVGVNKSYNCRWTEQKLKGQGELERGGSFETGTFYN